MTAAAIEAKPAGRWAGAMRIVRIVVIAWLIKVALTIVLWGVVKLVDSEKKTIDETVRATVVKTEGGGFVRTSVGTTYYKAAGPDSAPVVVLAAGSSVPSYIWQPTFDTLKASGYRVIAYDYLGRGWSDRPDTALTQGVYVQQLDELLDSLGVKKPIALAGLSYGGTIITSYASAKPSRVAALVYADPAFRTPGAEPWWMRWDPLAEVVMQWQSRNWASGQFDDFLHPEKFPDWANRYKVQMQYVGFRHGRIMDAIGNEDTDMIPLAVELGKQPRPVLALWGRQDQTVPFERTKMFLEMFPHAQLVPIDSAGHLPQWEQPLATHAALLEFLRANLKK